MECEVDNNFATQAVLIDIAALIRIPVTHRSVDFATHSEVQLCPFSV